LETTVRFSTESTHVKSINLKSNERSKTATNTCESTHFPLYAFKKVTIAWDNTWVSKRILSCRKKMGKVVIVEIAERSRK
jgi:hypothetical protein